MERWSLGGGPVHCRALGNGAPIFLAELAPPRISDTLQFFIDLLAAVPSVIYGLLGVFIVVPLMRTVIFPVEQAAGFSAVLKGPSYGVGFLTAGIVLAIMVIPYIISVSRKYCYRYHGTSGKRRWHWARHVGINLERGCAVRQDSILGSIFLALARALGETMAVTMVIGNVPTISASLFSPGDSIASVIANQFTEATATCICSPRRIRTGAVSDDVHPERAGTPADCGDDAKRQRVPT